MEGMACNKIYRTDVYGDVRFNVGLKSNEDCLYTYEIMKQCNRASYCSAKLYHWFFRNDSASQIKSVCKDFAPANVFVELYDNTKVLEDEEVANVLKYNYVSAAMKVLLFSKCSATDSDVIDSKNRCRLWRRDVWSRFSIKEKIKYILAIYLSLVLQIRF